MIRLNEDSIRQSLDQSATAAIEQLHTFSEIESTNTFLLNESAPAPGKFKVAVAESQTAGRGRMNRAWFAHPGSSICLSLSHTFVEMPKDPACLTLATGIGIIDALKGIQIAGINLKWPNDLLIDGRKVGGILTEAASGRMDTVVIGIGLNVDFDAAEFGDKDSELIANAVDLRSCNAQLPEPTVLVAVLIAGIQDALRNFAQYGFQPFLAAWDQVDDLRGKRVAVDQAEKQWVGTANGIADNGALLLETNGGTKRIVSGSVRLLDQEAQAI